MILVVGAGGRLGQAVTRELIARGHRVRAGCRAPAKCAALAGGGAEVVHIDLRQPEGFAAALEGVACVIAAAHGLTGRAGDSIAKVDIDGHKQLIDAAASAGVRRFVYTSAEGADLAHAVPFMRAKAEVERRLEQSGLDYAILRPSAFMELYVHDLIGARVLAGKRIMLLGAGTSKRNYVAVVDVAAAAVEAVEQNRPMPRVIEIGGPDTMSEREVADVYGRLSGKAVRIVSLPTSALVLIGRLLRPFHSGPANIIEMAFDQNRRTGPAFDASAMASLIGREPIGVADFVRSRIPPRAVP